MKNKLVLLQAKLNMREKSLNVLNTELEALQKRSDEVVESIDAVENEEDLNAIEPR